MLMLKQGYIVQRIVIVHFSSGVEINSLPLQSLVAIIWWHSFTDSETFVTQLWNNVRRIVPAWSHCLRRLDASPFINSRWK